MKKFDATEACTRKGCDSILSALKNALGKSQDARWLTQSRKALEDGHKALLLILCVTFVRMSVFVDELVDYNVCCLSYLW